MIREDLIRIVVDCKQKIDEGYKVYEELKKEEKAIRRKIDQEHSRIKKDINYYVALLQILK